MRPLGIDIGKACLGGILATVSLGGCVPGAFVSDYPESRYYIPGYGYSSAARLGYSSQPGYYGRNYYNPPIVYYGHDHDRRDCRHESHRDRRPRDEPARDARETRSPTRRDALVR